MGLSPSLRGCTPDPAPPSQRERPVLVARIDRWVCDECVGGRFGAFVTDGARSVGWSGSSARDVCRDDDVVRVRDHPGESIVRYRSGALLLCVGLASCRVGPDYETPEVALPDTWHTALRGGLEDGRWTSERWWQAFDDRVLTGLIVRATENNHDVRIALARVREARAQRGVANAARLPGVNGTGSIRRSQISESSREDDLPESVAGERTLYSTGFDAQWELDVFGGAARAAEAAQASHEAEIEATRDVLVSLWSEVAVNYIDVRVLQRRLAIADRNVDMQARSLELAESRFRAGLVPELDVHRARTQVATTKADIPGLRISLEAALNRLAVLVGEAPGSVHELVESAMPVPMAPATVAVGLPADMLRQRPDIRQSERTLAAETARQGVAEAELYPQFSLTGTFEWQSISTNNLWHPSSQGFSFGPSFRWRLFDGGRVRAQMAAADARAERALVTYEQTVLRAMEEVENALVVYVEERAERQALREAAAGSERSVELARALYRDGITGFQELLDAQRSLLDLQERLVENEGQLATSVVTLYKALGGGWEFAEIPLIADAGSGGDRLYGADWGWESWESR